MEPHGARSPHPVLCSAHPAHLSLVTVPKLAPVEMAGLAMTEAAVVMATARAGETARGTGAGPASLRAVPAASGGTATARAEVASAGAGEAGSGGVLVERWALRGRRGLLPGPPSAPPPRVPQREQRSPWVCPARCGPSTQPPPVADRVPSHTCRGPGGTAALGHGAPLLQPRLPSTGFQRMTSTPAFQGPVWRKGLCRVWLEWPGHTHTRTWAGLDS